MASRQERVEFILNLIHYLHHTEADCALCLMIAEYFAERTPLTVDRYLEIEWSEVERISMIHIAVARYLEPHEALQFIRDLKKWQNRLDP